MAPLRQRGPLIKATPVPEAPRMASLAERTTLFIVALKKDQAAELLDGFAPALTQAVRRCTKEIGALDSATRQARLAHEFGPSSRFSATIHALLTQAPPTLRAALIAQLPVHLRPAGAAPGAFPPALRSLAVRLVREARFS